ncbi:MAG: pirin family protein [Bacteroidota bacterium]
MYNKLINSIKPLGFTWQTNDPFLFCVHHQDDYPKGNEKLGPDASLKGRPIGQDFTVKDGWRMYHGETVPGFPAHPHRGFETITVVLEGFVDHSDSHGAAGRYGQGDVQWMTAGEGLQHAEMFPLLSSEKPNPLHLFQIWLNLPQKRKYCNPFYKMLWAENIPVHSFKDKSDREITIRLIAGEMDGIKPPDPAPDSWAADPDNEVAIWIIRMEPDASWTIPPAFPEIKRSLYFYKGDELRVAGVDIPKNNQVDLLADQPVMIENKKKEAYLLMLQGRPINEPVAQHGPFVMNTQEEIRKAFSDYRKTQFGGWPWNRFDNVHEKTEGRFAKYADGSIERP